VALFFAVYGPSDGRGSEVWVCSAGSLPLADDYADPFSIDAIVLYHSPHVTARIRVQSGCFTAHPPGWAWAGERFLIMIPNECRRKILTELAGLGINRAALFPDMDGLAANLNWNYSRIPPPPSAGPAIRDKPPAPRGPDQLVT
jgi:hypothetical protein